MNHEQPRLPAPSRYPLRSRRYCPDSWSPSIMASRTWLKHRRRGVWWSPPRDLPTGGRWTPDFPPTQSRSFLRCRGLTPSRELAEIEITLPNGSLAYVRAEDRPTFSFPVLAGQDPKSSLDVGRLVIGGILARENGIRVGDTILLGSGPRARRMVVGTIVATPEVGGHRIQMRYQLAEQHLRSPAREFGFRQAGRDADSRPNCKQRLSPVTSTSRSRP